MAIGIDGIDRSIKNIAELSFYNFDTQLVLNLPKPSDFFIGRNYQQKRIPTVSAYGNNTFSDSYVDGEDPQLQVVYSQWQPEIIALKLGTKFQQATENINISKALDAYETGTDLPLQVGDTAVTLTSYKASYTLNNQNVDATALAVVNLTNKTVNFDPSLADKRVTFQFTATVTNGLVSTSAASPNFRVSATLIGTDDQLIFLEIPKVTINFEGADFRPRAEQIDLNFFIGSVAGKCEPYTMIYSGETISC